MPAELTVTDVKVLLTGLRTLSVRNIAFSTEPVFRGSPQRGSGGTAVLPKPQLPSFQARISAQPEATADDPDTPAAMALWTSPPCPRTLNPSWLVPPRVWLDAPPSVELRECSMLIVEVFNVPDPSLAPDAAGDQGLNEEKCELTERDPVLRVCVDVHLLVPLPPELALHSAPPLPLNALFFTFSDEDVYTPESVLDAMCLHSAGPYTQPVLDSEPQLPTRAVSSEDQEPLPKGRGGRRGPKSLAEAEELLAEVLRLEAEAQDLQERAAQALATAGHQRRQGADTAKLARLVRQQQELLDEEQALLEREQAELDSDLHAASEEAAALEELSERVRRLTEEERAARLAGEHESAELLRSQQRLEDQQARMVAALQTVFPIGQVEPEVVYSIRNLELSLDLYSKDDEVVSSALGATAHLTLMLAKYLQVNLRYAISYGASRSSIRDVVKGSIALPLFRKGTERLLFESAVLLLERNIDQLLVVRGFGQYARRRDHMLRKLQLLLQFESHALSVSQTQHAP